MPELHNTDVPYSVKTQLVCEILPLIDCVGKTYVYTYQCYAPLPPPRLTRGLVGDFDPI